MSLVTQRKENHLSKSEFGLHLSNNRISDSWTGCGLKGHLWADYLQHRIWCYCPQILRLVHRILFNTKMKLLFFATKNMLWLHQKPNKHVDVSSCKILMHSSDRRQWWSRCWPCRHAKETLPQSTFKSGSCLCLHSFHIVRSALACHGCIYIEVYQFWVSLVVGGAQTEKGSK